jgi:hypothetical protein
LLRLEVGAVIAPLVFGMMSVPLLWLMALTLRRGETPPRPSLLTYPMMVVVAVVQAYFWGLWAAYCAALVISRIAYWGVTHKWLYYAVALQALLTPLAYLMSKERMSATTQREARGIASGTMLYSAVALVAFAVFVCWPGLIYVPYGWASGVVLEPVPEKGVKALRKLEEKYFADLDAWVARGPVLRPGDPGGEAAFKARVQPMVETCGKLVLLTATPRQQTEFLSTDRAEFDFRVDVCSKMTINRLHAQPEFQKPELVQQICNSTIPVFRELCVRSGLRK